MKNWDQDDAYEFPGDHYVITNGYDVVVDQLVQKAKDVGVEFKLGKSFYSNIGTSYAETNFRSIV